MRLNKFLAERLGIARREADEAISRGEVTVDGKVARLGMPVEEGAEVRYRGEAVAREAEYLYVALNKPRGVVCSRKSQDGSRTVYELLPERYRKLKTVGRLDKESEGLILLTNDGDFAFRMTHPKFTKAKIYDVILDRDLEPLHQQMIADFGVELTDGKSRLGLERMEGGEVGERGGARGEDEAAAERGGGEVGERGGEGESRRFWRVTMSEGRNRQIRRTFGALGYTVVGLKRVAFGKYELGELGEGEFREERGVVLGREERG